VDQLQRRLAEDALAAATIGAALIAFAIVTLALKIAFIVQLTLLAIQVATAIAAAFATFGATAAATPGFIAATRAICRLILQKVVAFVETVIKDILKKAKDLLRKVESKFAARAERRAAERFEHQLADDLRRVNPHFDPADPAYSMNCTHCIQAYELRRRGLDVEAAPLPQQFQPNMNWPGGRLPGTVEQVWGRNLTKGSHADIVQAFEQAGPGSRGFVATRWNQGGGHVFSVENVDGNVRFVDAQTGSTDVAHYFTQGHSTSYMRLDDLPTPGSIGAFVTPRP